MEHSLAPAQIIHGSLDSLLCGRETLPDDRHDLIANLVSCIITFGIRAVDNIILAFFAKISFDIVPPDAKKRTDNPPVSRTHPRQSGHSGPPKQIQEKCFHVVIQMMRNGNRGTPLLSPHFFKPAVTQLPACHFHRHMVRLHVGRHVEMLHNQKISLPPPKSCTKHSRGFAPSPPKWKLQ